MRNIKWCLQLSDMIETGFLTNRNCPYNCLGEQPVISQLVNHFAQCQQIMVLRKFNYTHIINRMCQCANFDSSNLHRNNKHKQ